MNQKIRKMMIIMAGDIFNILNQISNLNSKIRNYSKRNKERGSKIRIEEENEDSNEDNNDKESQNNMDIE